jgi:hypothetical protein
MQKQVNLILSDFGLIFVRDFSRFIVFVEHLAFIFFCAFLSNIAQHLVIELDPNQRGEQEKKFCSQEISYLYLLNPFLFFCGTKSHETNSPEPHVRREKEKEVKHQTIKA